jgi:NADH:ubiquinone oxidoreductase subunit F (NADH-binding)
VTPSRTARTGGWAPTAPELDAGTLPRLLVRSGSPDLDRHIDRYGPLRCPPGQLAAEVGRAGIQGRGGAGFPSATKMAAVAGGRRAIVVANGTEGEPASSKDRVLLTSNPHLVLDGAVAAAEAVGATEVLVCVDRRARRAHDSVWQAADQRRLTGVDPVPIRVEAAPDRYVAGEESALVHWLSGGEAKPTATPPRPYERGVDRRPTLVQNVETLAHVGLVARYGAEWHRSVGTADAPGSALFSVLGHVQRPGVIEAALGSPAERVVAAAGGTLSGVEAVLVGGYFGTWVPAEVLAPTPLGGAPLDQVGASLGCGVLAVLPPQACGLAETARVARWLAGQSAGQCGPCTNGLPAIAGALEQLVAGDRRRRAEDQLHRWLAMVEGRGACRHPDGAVRLVRSALATFADHIGQHRRRGPCRQHQPVLPTPTTGGWR